MGTSIALPAGADLIINQYEDAEPEKTESAAYEDDGKGNHDLPADLQSAFKAMLRHYGGVVDRAARRQEVIAARRGRLYWRLVQYVYFNQQASNFLPIIAGQVVSVGDREVTMPRYTASYDIYRAYGRNYTAVLAQNPPGSVFEPVNPEEPADSKIAELAQRYSEHYDQVNHARAMQRRMGRLFWTDGRVVGRTFHRISEQAYGTDAQGRPRGEEVTRLYGVLEAKVFPITAEEIEDVTGVILSDDPDVNRAKADYDWLAKGDKIKGGTSTGETGFERNMRIGILEGRKSQTTGGDTQSHLAERQMMYLRPCAFEESKDAKEKLKELFPQGARITFVSGEYAEAYPVALDDEIDIRHAMDGDGQNRPAWGAPVLPLQDAVNNYENMTREYHDYGIPETYYDKALFDGQSRREKGAQPGEYTGVINPAPGTNLGQYFYTTTPAIVPSDLLAAKQELRDAWAQFTSAIQPAMFGANISKGGEDRVGVYEMAREQAMGVLALPWGAIQSAFAQYKYQAVIAAGKYRNDDDVIRFESKAKGRGKPRPVSISVSDLKNKGKFRARPDTDSSFPATRQMKGQAFEKLASAAAVSPMIAEALQHPDNVEFGLDMMGLSADFDMPAAHAWRRQIDEIEQLISSGPIPPTRAMVEQVRMKAAAQAAITSAIQDKAAPPLPPELSEPTEQEWIDPGFIKSGRWLEYPIMQQLAKCSVQPNKHDYHQYHMQAIDDWFNSDKRDKAAESPEGRMGLFNLDLHYDLHKQMMAAKMAEQKSGDQTPPKKSMNFKDLPPEGQAQLAEQGGITLAPPAAVPPGAQPQQPQSGAAQ